MQEQNRPESSHGKPIGNERATAVSTVKPQTDEPFGAGFPLLHGEGSPAASDDLDIDVADAITAAVETLRGVSEVLDYRTTAQPDNMLSLLAGILDDQATQLESSLESCA